VEDGGIDSAAGGDGGPVGVGVGVGCGGVGVEGEVLGAVGVAHFAEVAGDDGAGVLPVPDPLDVVGQFGGSVEGATGEGLLHHLLQLPALLVLALLELGGDEDPALHGLVGPELSELVQDGGVPQGEALPDLLQVQCVGVLPLFPVLQVLSKYGVHCRQLLLCDGGADLAIAAFFASPLGLLLYTLGQLAIPILAVPIGLVG